jgi:hypothetical protein
MIAGTLAVAVALAMLVWLTRPAMRTNAAWRAVATPVASIIGSGFLVSVPILRDLVGAWAVFAMAGLLVLAYLIGAAVRWNIAHVEPLLAQHARARALVSVERLSHVVLAFAYFVSVAYYLVLFAAFALKPMGLDSPLMVKAVVSALLATLGVVGLWRGFGAVERLEVLTVCFKLAVIAGLIAGLVVFDLSILGDGETLAAIPAGHIERAGLPALLGLLIMVQGFETSRFLGSTYDAALRICTMKIAQLVAAAIYLVFFILVLPLMGTGGVDDGVAAIVDMLAPVSIVLPLMVLAGALASQSSAALADAIGAGGLLHDITGGRVHLNHTYPLIALVSALIVWETDVFSLIALASRCFALYYALQCLVAALSAARQGKGVRATGFAALAFACFAIVLLGTPAETA